jgi:hypothetical protein
MFTLHDRRGRHQQAARNLAIAVVSAALAGSGAAMAAGDGAAPPTDKPATTGADCPKPGITKGERVPLAADDVIVTAVRTRLQGLVADGAIEQSEADAVLQEVIAGSVNMGALTRDGKVSEAHAPTIDEALREIKRAHVGADDAHGQGAAATAAKRTKAAAARRAAVTAGA